MSNVRVGRILLAWDLDQWDKFLGTLLLEPQEVAIDMAHLCQTCSIKYPLGGRGIKLKYDRHRLSEVLAQGPRAQVLAGASHYPVQLALG